MGADDLMLAMTLGGIGLTVAHLKVELSRRSRLKAREQRRQLALQALYFERLSLPDSALQSAKHAAAAVPTCPRGTAASQSRCPLKRAA